MQPILETPEILAEILFVLLPRHAVYAGRCVLLYRKERCFKPVERDVVKERTESLAPAPTSSLSHTVQRTWHVIVPALGPGRVLLLRVLLGQSPSLHRFRPVSVRFVQPPHR
jgi:hypothetical protein